MMFYKNVNAMVQSPDGDTAFFDIICAILERNILVPYLAYILLRLLTSSIHRYKKRNWFHIEKKPKNADDIQPKL